MHSLTLLSQNEDYGFEQLHNFFSQERIKIDDGISSGSATCFLKDRKGFIWIGTDMGLNRYDGYGFKTYYRDESDTNSLSDDFLTCLCEDKEGMIWIGTLYEGLHKYNPELETFTHYPKGQDDPYDLSHSTISALCTDPSGDIWFGVQGNTLMESVYRLDLQTEEIGCIEYDSVNPDSQSFIHSDAIIQAADGTMWLGMHAGLSTYDSITKRLIVFPLDEYSGRYQSNEVTTLYEDGDGIIWAGSWGGGLYLFDRKENQYSRNDLVQNHLADILRDKIAAITEDRIGNILFRTATSIEYLDKQSNQLISCEHTGRKRAFEYYTFKSLLWDKSGSIWFSLPGISKEQAGIYKLNIRHKNFHHISPEQLKFKSPEKNWISSVVQDTCSNIWVGGSAIGLTMISTLQSPYSLYNYSATTNKPNSLFPVNVSAIYQDRQGVFWIGNWDDGSLNKLEISGNAERVMCYKPGKQVYQGVPYTPGQEFLKSTVFTFTGSGSMRIYEDNKGNLWIARGTGLEIFDRTTEEFHPYILDHGKHDFSDLPVITSITEDEDGCLWISTMHQGLFKVIPPVNIDHSDRAAGIQTVSYKFDPDMPKDLGELMLTSLCIPQVNKEMKLWIGTMEGGLFGLRDNETSDGIVLEQFVKYTKKDGLSDNSVLGVLEDQKGNLWLSTENGLSRFNPQSKMFNTYDESDGLPVHHFHWLSSYKGRDGMLFFGGQNGLLAFYPENVIDNPAVPPVVITDFRIFNKPVPIGKDSPLEKTITETEKLELSYRENYLSFGFAALNYVSPEKNQYRYMMEGVDEDWIDAGTTRAATYSSLKHGRYTFKVSGSNNDGLWNEEGTSLGIVINPPPWLKWWAYLIYGLVLTAIILLYRRYLLNQAQLRTELEVERVEKEKVQELDQMKSRFFANISHEFRTPLTLITGPIDDLLKSGGKMNQRNRNLLGMMKRNTRRLQQLINQLLELSQLETGRLKLEVSEGNLSGYLRSIASSFLSFAEKKGVLYTIDIEEETAQFCFDKDKVEKIVTNLISNALKFTKVGDSVTVVVSYQASSSNRSLKEARIMVSDTGPGIPEEDRDQVFDRFHQVVRPGGKYTEGTGIGLALVKELVDLYRGKIELVSETGKGSEFTVILPVSKERFSEDEIVKVQTEAEVSPSIYPDSQGEHIDITGTHQPEKIKSGDDRPLILVVEDNEDLRKYITQSLDIHYQILEAENGMLGLEKAIESIPDLVISDLMMPEMDGMELCELLRSDDRTSHIPLIMLTAKADKWSKLDSYEKGADDYILKPFDAVELQSRVSNLIAQRKRLREKYRKEFLIDTDTIEAFPEASNDFFIKVLNLIKSNLSDSEYSVEQLCQDVGLSQSQLYRKLTALTDHSPVEFIRNIRLKTAAELFRKGQKNVSTVLYSVGFNTPSHFSRYFRELYGVNPSDYIRKIQTIPD